MTSVQGGFCKRRLFIIFLILLSLLCTAEACKEDITGVVVPTPCITIEVEPAGG